MKLQNRYIAAILLFSIFIVGCGEDPTQSENQSEAPSGEGGGPDIDDPENLSETWLDFLYQTDDNVLADFSYAGYKYGEVVPPDVSTLGYTTYDITSYGAIPDDGLSDQAAFESAVNAAIADPVGGIVYCPEGTYELRAYDDNETMIFNGGDFVIKGAGRDKSILKMSYANPLTDPDSYWTASTLIVIKHNSGTSALSTITEDTARGGYSVTVASTSGLSQDMWVSLELANAESNVVKYALGEGDLEIGETRLNNLASGSNIETSGVQVTEFHRIKKISGNIVTFYEPIHHTIYASWNWSICKYNNYANVGVEDICFEAEAPTGFGHHVLFDTSYGTDYSYDCSFSPLGFMRLTDSWIRRVNFVSVSEAFVATLCANVSAYDIKISGNRGHSAVKSQYSTKVFIGKVIDTSSDGKGQWHATGIAKPAIGTVLWRNEWGTDSCYESHATQPRVSLFDMCTGAFMRGKQGGDASQLPNHMEGMVMWNFCATSGLGDVLTPWWDYSDTYWKLLPVSLVGFHGATSTFDPTDTKVDESHGTMVFPESLYEAQLERRLGSVPTWLLDLKSI